MSTIPASTPAPGSHAGLPVNEGEQPAAPAAGMDVNISDEEYQRAAVRWSSEFLFLPVLECQETLKYMTGMANCTAPVKIPTVDGKAQMAPFDALRESSGQTEIIFRELVPYLGNVALPFVPANYINLIIGQGPNLGDGQTKTPLVKLVIGAAMKSIGAHLHDALWTAKRNPAGTTTADLFDGWLTILEKETEAGNLSAEKGNLLENVPEITAANAVDIFKKIERACAPELRNQKKFLFCAPEHYDAYCDGYLMTHTATPYNKEYDQPLLEGSGGKTTIVPLPGLAGQNTIIVTPKSNMVYGYDNMSNTSRLELLKKGHWTWSLGAAMWFGCQFRTLDRRMLNVAKIA